MKGFLKVLLFLAVFALCLFGLNYAYSHNPYVHALFAGGSATGIVESVEGAASSAEMRAETAGRISMYIFALICAGQVAAFLLAATIIGHVRASSENAPMKLKRLENADIFFDVPLYVGLFGTVSSFLVMTFSPQSSRLIAYSSTLIGIIFSVTLRTILLYPLRQTLIARTEEEMKN